MSATIQGVSLIGHDPAAAALGAQAALRAFPDAKVTHLRTWPGTLAADASRGGEMIVILDPEATYLDEVAGARDARGRSRWAVVARRRPAAGSPSAQLVAVDPADWTLPVVATALAMAARLRTLQALNQQLRGDLQAISRRFGHDFRSPLNCILAANEAMKDPQDGPASPRTVFAESIGNSVDEVVRLVDRMNFVLRATNQPPAYQSVAMEEVIWDALQRLEPRLRAGGISVTKPAQWPVITSVPAWLEVIWANLLRNSLDHGGAEAHIELGWESREEAHCFWVRDRGAGVARSVEPLLFHPFDRLGELNAPRGIGLPIVHRLVELLGGTCGHEHEPADRGSGKFFFVLPAHPPAAP